MAYATFYLLCIISWGYSFDDMSTEIPSNNSIRTLIEFHRLLHRAYRGHVDAVRLSTLTTEIWAVANDSICRHFANDRVRSELVKASLETTLLGFYNNAVQFKDGAKEQLEQAVSGYESIFTQMALLGLTAARDAWGVAGRACDSELQDAKRLLTAVLANPIGSRNGLVWYELGWVLDGLSAPQKEVGECFYQASRLLKTSDYQDVWHRASIACLLFEYPSIDKTIMDGLDPGMISVPTLQNVILSKGVMDPADIARIRIDTLETFLLLSTRTSDDLRDGLLVWLTEDLVERDRLFDSVMILMSNFVLVCGVATQDLDILLPAELADQSHDVGHISSGAAVQALELALKERVLKLQEILAARVVEIETEVERLNRLLMGAVKESEYWRNSVQSIEEEARVGGFPLHEYTILNPFKRKQKERHEQTRLLHQQCAQNYTNQQNTVMMHQQRTDIETQKLQLAKAKILSLMDRLVDAPISITS